MCFDLKKKKPLPDSLPLSCSPILPPLFPPVLVRASIVTLTKVPRDFMYPFYLTAACMCMHIGPSTESWEPLRDYIFGNILFLQKPSIAQNSLARGETS